MSTPDEAHIDEVIFSFLKPRLQKVAMIIGRTAQFLEKEGFKPNFDLIGARVEALCRDNRIDCAGDVTKWRCSEIKLLDPDGGPDS